MSTVFPELLGAPEGFPVSRDHFVPLNNDISQIWTQEIEIYSKLIGD